MIGLDPFPLPNGAVKRGCLVFLALAAVYSAFFACNIGRTYYWHDFVWTRLFVSGHSPAEVRQILYDGQPKTAQELLRFQSVNGENDIFDTVSVLAKHSPQHQPLYFILLHSWAKLAGNADIVFRVLSVLIWFLFLLCAYFLGGLLFRDQTAALVTVVLVFFSPRFINYSLDVWEYGLFALIAALSGVSFLRAVQGNTAINWFFYFIATVLGLYTHVFFGFVIIAQGMYFILYLRHIRKSEKAGFVIALLSAFMCYVPWVVLLLRGKHMVFGWAKGGLSAGSFLTTLVSTVTGIFYSFPGTPDFLYPFLYTAAVVIVIAAIVFLIKHIKRPEAGYILLTTAVPFLGLIFIDRLFGFRYASVGRFFLPALLGLVLAVSYFVSAAVNSKRCWVSRAGIFLVCLLVLAGTISMLPGNGEPSYSGYGSEVSNAARIINYSRKPLVAGEDWEDVFPLAYKLRPGTQFLFVDKDTEIEGRTGFADIFFVCPGKRFLDKARGQGIILNKTQNNALWLMEVNR